MSGGKITTSANLVPLSLSGVFQKPEQLPPFSVKLEIKLVQFKRIDKFILFEIIMNQNLVGSRI